MLISKKPCKVHVNLSGPFRRLITEEEYTPDGKPQVGTQDFYFCIQCGASFHDRLDKGLGPLSPGAVWDLPVIFQRNR